VAAVKLGVLAVALAEGAESEPRLGPGSEHGLLWGHSETQGRRKLRSRGKFFKRIFAPTEKLAPTGKIGAYGKNWRL
jgi:hypothetical protein